MKELKEALVEIRKQNFAIDNEEFKIGVKCIAAPIRDQNGKVIAAISIAFPSARSSPEQMKKFENLILETSGEISRQLGFVAGRRESVDLSK